MNERQFGLVGKNIYYSFSQSYFSAKFKELQLLNHSYQVFDIDDISKVETVCSTSNLVGLNVTIPYKESIIPFLDELSDEAKEIGAVNTIFFKNNRKIGFNTDYCGFKESLKPILKSHHQKVLLLGNGGASKAIQFALKNLQIPYTIIARNSELDFFSITEKMLQEHQIIVQTTPVGTFPSEETVPFPFHFLNEQHLAYDLIYNPEKTAFLSEAERNHASIKNGLEMLHLQAEKSWEIWNS